MKPLSKEEIDKSLKNLSEWNFEGDKIHRDFEFADFKTALSFHRSNRI